MRAFKIYDFTLSAGGALTLLVEGGVFKIISCTGVVAVTIDGGSTIGPINAGQGMKTEFSRLTISDMSGAANVGRIAVASNDFIDDRISGEVLVIDGGKATTMSGQAFSGNLFCGAVAAQYAHIQHWNASTTKHSIVDQILMSSTTAINATVRAHNAALSTLCTQAAPANKRIGQADSVMEQRQQNSVAVIPTGKVLGSLMVAANTQTVYKFTRPLIVPPSQSICINATVLNTDLTVVFETYEEAV